MSAAMKRSSTTALARHSFILPTIMPSDTYYPHGGIININYPPIIHNQLCISPSDPTLVTMELSNSRRAAHQEEAVNSNHQPGTNAMRFLAKIRSLCTISFGKHGSLPANGSSLACISLYDSTLGTTEVFTLPQVARQRKQEEAMNSNHRPGETAMRYRYLTRICTILFGKPGPLSTNCVRPSHNFLSDVLEATITIHSLSSLATTDADADDTFVTADELIHVSDLAPLASEVVKEELYIRGYLKRPNQGNPFLCKPQYFVVPRLLQVLHDRWPKQVAVIPVSSKNPQHPSPRAIGRRGGLTVAEALKSANIEENPRTPAPTRSSSSNQSIYWSCQSPQTAIDSSTSPFVQESTMSTPQFCDFCEYSYITSHTTPPSSPELAGLNENEKDVLGTTSSFSEAILRSLAPRVALMKAKSSYMEVDARSFQRLRYGEVCHHHLV
ncbi:uncharacterized protein EDB93DRAFT_1253621 [Suillus bovinus]|uniref:uncharacterized protein n=1 Tax=Suillus bovinus TaxID=48563 RepID=UPI001B87AE94|nr:uncharacterized protein EDB93DRAFT_1253621 [Suillus bovinus]KAG2137615.1 hypothetical protein EDB93DRAFT_1253621 [Suillus bovinus]